MTVEIYSQRDERWAARHLGLPQAAAGSTIGAYGCGVTAIAQRLTLMGFETTPPQVNDRLLRFDAFRHVGSFNFIAWERVPLAYPQFVYRGRDDTPNRPAPVRVMKALSDKLAIGDQVIIYVDASPYERGLQQHFVLAVGELKSGIQIMNPWTGRQQDLRSYGRTDAIAVCGVIWLDTDFDASAAL